MELPPEKVYQFKSPNSPEKSASLEPPVKHKRQKTLDIKSKDPVKQILNIKRTFSSFTPLRLKRNISSNQSFLTPSTAKLDTSQTSADANTSISSLLRSDKSLTK